MLSTRSKFHNPPRCFQPDKGRSSTAYCESCLSRLLLFATQHGGIDFLVSSRGFQTFFSSSSKRLPSWIPDTAVRRSRCHSRLAWPLSLRSPDLTGGEVSKLAHRGQAGGPCASYGGGGRVAVAAAEWWYGYTSDGRVLVGCLVGPPPVPPPSPFVR